MRAESCSDLQEAWLASMSSPSCAHFSAGGTVPSQTRLNSGTRARSAYTCSARCCSLNPPAVIIAVHRKIFNENR